MIQKNILTEKLGISKGTVCILAMLGKNLWELPYFEKDKTEKIKERLLKY